MATYEYKIRIGRAASGGGDARTEILLMLQTP